MYVGGGRKPKFTGRYLPKIKVCVSVYPNFSFRQLPWASVGFHLLRYRWDADNNVCGMGRGAGRQSSWANIYLKLGFSVLLIPILASASFRRLPWASVDFRGLPSPHISLGRRQQCLREGRGWKPKFLIRYLPKIGVFSAVYPQF